MADKKIDDGGVAFGTCSMSLRDWFAGQALAGFMDPISRADEASLKKIAEQNGLTGFVTNARIAASVAYGYADAMIAARKGGAA